MAYEYPAQGGLDYFPCRYGKSKLLFRGPRRRIDGDYLAVIGGSETYGKFVADPYPALLEQGLGQPVVNFGYMNAGIDVFVNEPTVIDICSKALVTVVQLMGAQNTSNRFYAVHPRRNDRFLRASPLMKTIFREVDFTEFNFTRHMLTTLRVQAPDKFPILVEELRAAWLARMKLLLQRIEGKVVLLWIEPPALASDSQEPGRDPFLVDADLVARVRPLAAGLVRLPACDLPGAGGSSGMIFSDLEEPQTHGMPGPACHAEIAHAMEPELRGLLE